MNIVSTLNLVAAAAILIPVGMSYGQAAAEPTVVEFNGPAAAAPAAPPVSVAKDYANAHGLTNCRTPATAELDDVFLASPVDQPGTIVEIGLDAALDSAGKRTVLLACDAA